jgi:hypothetical protein
MNSEQRSKTETFFDFIKRLTESSVLLGAFLFLTGWSYQAGYYSAECLRCDLQIEVHRSDHEAQAYDRLIVTRGGSFCKTPSLESPMSLPSGTRQRPPQSGFVQTGL